MAVQMLHDSSIYFHYFGGSNRACFILWEETGLSRCKLECELYARQMEGESVNE